MTSSNTYKTEKGWHGVSCACGGGYRVGHREGCTSSDLESDIEAVARDLERARANEDTPEIEDLDLIYRTLVDMRGKTVETIEKELNETVDKLLALEPGVEKGNTEIRRVFLAGQLSHARGHGEPVF